MMSGISGPEAARARITVESHLALSATINWHLAARKIDLGALLRVILGPARVSDRAPLLETLSYLRCATGSADARAVRGRLALPAHRSHARAHHA